MTPAQAQLLKALINADREYHSKIAAGQAASLDDRGIEVGWTCNARTANTLVELGLAEIVNIRTTQNYIFLGKYKPYDEVEL